MEELSHVLWTYRTISCRSIGETPFSMTYGVEVVIPLETGFPTLRTSSFTLSYNDGLLGKSLDLMKSKEKMLWFNWHTINTSSSKGCKAKFASTWRLGFKKGFGYYKEPSMGKVMA